MQTDHREPPHARAATDAWLAHVAIGILRAAGWLNGAGLVLALVNLLLAGVMAPVAVVYLVLGLAAATVGAAQLWLLVRIEIDRPLFRALASSCEPQALAGLDGALAELGWLAPERAGRPLALRVRGVRRFLAWAAVLVILQWLFALLLLLLR